MEEDRLVFSSQILFYSTWVTQEADFFGRLLEEEVMTLFWPPLSCQLQWVPYSVSALSNKGLAGQQSLLREVLTCVLQGSPLLLLSIPPPSLAPLSAWGGGGDKGVSKPGRDGAHHIRLERSGWYGPFPS